MSGKKRYATRTIKVKTRELAERELRKLEKSVAAGKHPRGTTAVTLGEQLDAWLDSASAGLAIQTRKSYQMGIDRAKPIHKIPLGKLTPRDLDSLYTKLSRTLAPATVRKTHNVIRQALDQAVRYDMVPRNVATIAKPPPIHSQHYRPPSLDELARFLREGDDEGMKAFLFVASTTGARRGELVALQWRDVDFERSVLRISRSAAIGDEGETIIKDTKTHKDRPIPLAPEVVAVLKALQERSEAVATRCAVALTPKCYVFSPRPGSRDPYTPMAISRKFARLRDRLGMESDLHLHGLRHFTITQLIAAGIDVRTVMAIAGHSRASTTLDIYSHAVTGTDVVAAGVIGKLVGEQA